MKVKWNLYSIQHLKGFLSYLLLSAARKMIIRTTKLPKRTCTDSRSKKSNRNNNTTFGTQSSFPSSSSSSYPTTTYSDGFQHDHSHFSQIPRNQLVPTFFKLTSFVALYPVHTCFSPLSISPGLLFLFSSPKKNLKFKTQQQQRQQHTRKKLYSPNLFHTNPFSMGIIIQKKLCH